MDVQANRRARKWSRREQFGRVIWSLAVPLFALSPRVCWGWRRGILRMFGARIERGVHIYPTVRIAIPWNLRVGAFSAIGDGARLYDLGHIEIGENVTISQGAHLCAGSHDWRQPSMPLLKPPISIRSGAWICADAFIGPGTTVGENAIVGARAVVMSNVAPGTIVAGNPARVIRRRDTLCDITTGSAAAGDGPMTEDGR